MTQGHLRKKSLSAVAWSACEALARQTIQLVTTILLARLVAPEQFGLVAMLALFTGLATAFTDCGFTSALIQKQEVTREDSSSVLYFNIAMGLAAALLLCLAAPWIAAFYQAPILTPLTRVMALNLFLSTFGSVHQALLAKSLDFRCLTRITVIATLVAGGVAVTLAWRGWGPYSLVAQPLVSTLVSTVLLWWWFPWRPALAFSYRALRALFRFGSYLLASSLLETVHSRLYTLLIGKLYSARDLGFYSRADGTQLLAANLFSSIVDRVAYPLFSSAAADRNTLQRGIRRALSGVLLINAPAMLGLLAVAQPLVRVLFGERWSPSVPYLQILCLAGVLWPLHVINLSALKALGRSDLFLRVEIIKKAVGFGVITLAATISIRALAWSQVLLGAFCYYVNTYYIGMHLDYPALAQVRDNGRCLLAAGLMCGGVWLLGRVAPLPAGILLSLQVAAGLVLYAGLCGLFRVPAYVEGLRDLRARLPWLRILPGQKL